MLLPLLMPWNPECRPGKAAAEGKGASAVYRAASKAAHRLRSLKEERKHPNLPAMPHIYYRDGAACRLNCATHCFTGMTD